MESYDGSNSTADESLVNFIHTLFKNPITGILLKKSNLTKRQFETLIIDVVSDYKSEEKISYANKTVYGTIMVSRGSFCRTLSQARRNVISSIYTILLLNYIGVFDGVPFDDYRIISEKLREYVKTINTSERNQQNQLLKNIETELLMGITKLAEPRSLKVL